MWSYASHGALCSVTTSHSTCGYFFYKIENKKRPRKCTIVSTIL